MSYPFDRTLSLALDRTIARLEAVPRYSYSWQIYKAAKRRLERSIPAGAVKGVRP